MLNTSERSEHQRTKGRPRKILPRLQAMAKRLPGLFDRQPPRESELQATLETFHATLDASQDAIIVFDERRDRIHYSNRGAQKLLDHTRQSLAQLPFTKLVKCKDASELCAHLSRPRSRTVTRFPLSLIARDGSHVPVEAVVERIPGASDDQARCFMVARDRRDSLRAQREIDWISHHDPLTNLLNRSGFLHAVEDELRRCAQDTSVLMVAVLGVDRFKRINDAQGTAMGDMLLMAVGERLSQAMLRHPKAIIARLGGDEFAIALPVANGDRGMQLVDWLRQTVERQSFSLGGMLEDEGTPVTVSSGLTFARSGMNDANELLRQANAALVRAKALGRNRLYRYTTGLLDEASRYQQIEKRLAGAFARHDFFLHYQPIWQIAGDTRRTGAEALLRWHDDELGNIGPDIFVPILEENGQMVELGRWILDTALDALAKSRAASEGIFVSVNVSAVQLMNDPDLANHIIASLNQRRLPASSLELEITETALIQSPSRVGRQLAIVHEAGVRIALDDFGTGFSSLSHLKQFPFDTVKIDRSFIAGLPSSKGDCAIVESLLRLCEGFGRHVCAEGIEKAEQLDYLKRQGCHRAQGYHMGRPGPSFDEAIGRPAQATQ